MRQVVWRRTDDGVGGGALKQGRPTAGGGGGDHCSNLRCQARHQTVGVGDG